MDACHLMCFLCTHLHQALSGLLPALPNKQTQHIRELTARTQCNSVLLMPVVMREYG